MTRRRAPRAHGRAAGARVRRIPIVNKRISVTPIAEICAATTHDRPHPHRRGHGQGRKRWAWTSWAASARSCTKGASAADSKLMDSIPRAVRHRQRGNQCERGLHARRHQHGRRAQDGGHHQGYRRGRSRSPVHRRRKLVVFCNAVEDNPFMAARSHGSGEDRQSIERGRHRSRRNCAPCWPTCCRRNADITSVAETIKATAFKITRAGELAAREASSAWACSRASSTCRCFTPAEGDSVAEILGPSAWEAGAAAAPRRRSPCSTTR